MVTCSRGFYLGCLVLWTHLNGRIGMPANGRSVWCQYWYSHFIALLPVPCECPKPPQALEQYCRSCGELNKLSCEATLPSPAAQSMVTDFYSSRHYPLSWPVYSFSYLFIFWGRAQIIPSYHYFTFLDIATWRILKGQLGELTRTAVLSLHHETDSCSSLYGPCSQTSCQVRQNLCSWKVCVHAQEEMLDCKPSLPRFLCFSKPNYFPSGEEKQGWLTGWSWVSSADSLTAWWCTHPADVRTGDSGLTAQDWDIEKMKPA